MHVAFYVSGHGFGHSTRAIVTVSALAESGHSVTVVTVSPPGLFADIQMRFPDKIALRRDSRALDPGIAQKDAVTVDLGKSVADMWAFLVTWEQVRDEEIEWIRASNVDCVVLDAPFVPAVAARICGVPSILISNFTFDTIFEGVFALDPSNHQAREVCKLLKELYSHTDYLLRLPGAIPSALFDSKDRSCEHSSGSFERAAADAADTSQTASFASNACIQENTQHALQMLARAALPNPSPQNIQSVNKAHDSHRARVFNMPLVVRMAKTPRLEMRALLGIPLDACVVLVTFGGHNVTPSTPDRVPSPVKQLLNDEDGDDDVHDMKAALSGIDASSGAESVRNNVLIEISAHLNSAAEEATSFSDSFGQLIPDGWHALICVPGPKGDLLDDFIESNDASRVTIAIGSSYVPDLVQASDVVVGKCGYGTCSEVIAHNVPLVYVPRPAFVEEEGLVHNLMKPFGMSTEMPQKEFYAGKWSEYILRAFRLKEHGPAAKIRLDGAAVAVNHIEDIVLVRRSIVKTK
ncbi:hypothetical protein BJ741DRAFT_605171 [Chytriomyces cf. hyalinus JEL632]|nr:hypothetical protein BJ741DRAFT_605171 [Chytriomyces cf. hyalinus JEL632]